MTLKDKFDNPIMRHDLGRNEIEETKEQCAEIAEDFAVGFAEWFWEHHEAFYSGERDYYLEFNELLEIYKKEKAL